MACLATATEEEEEVEEEHQPEVDGEAPDLASQRLHEFLVGIQRIIVTAAHLHDAKREAQVHEVEADLEETIRGIGDVDFALEDVEHEYPPIAEERACHVKGEPCHHGQVDEVREDDLVAHDC